MAIRSFIRRVKKAKDLHHDYDNIPVEHLK